MPAQPQPLAAPVKLGVPDATAPLKALPGRWTGTGVAQLANGHREPFSCVVTYIHDTAKSELRQGVRCESPNIKMSTSAVMQISGTALNGSWEEKLHDAKGKVTGQLTADGIRAAVTHQARAADVQVVALSACEQSVTLVATKPGDMVQAITAQLRKC